MNDMNVRTYGIKDVADRFHIEQSALRYYEDSGLLPGVERNASGRRVYTDWHIDRLGTILCFKQAGMTIDELQRFFAYENGERENIDAMVDLLEHRHQEIIKQEQALHDAHQQVLRKLHFFQGIRQSYIDGTPKPDWSLYAGQHYED